MSSPNKPTEQQQQLTSPTNNFQFTTKTFALLIALLALTLAFTNPIRQSLTSLLPTAARPLRTMSTSSLKITKQPWSARGHSDHDWLYTFHTFSFAGWQSTFRESFGPLRVINEDRVKPTTGFGAHSHAEFLIFSYIVNGTLEHRDSMGNLEYLKRGEVQFTSAGTGIRHSEYNRDKNDEVHFLQIWAKPDIRGLKPHYETKKFTDEQKADKLVRVMESTSRLGEKTETSPIGLQADLSMDASILSPGKKVVHEVVAEGPRKVLVQLVMNGRKQPKEGGAKIKVGDVVLGEGDAAFVEGVKGPGQVEVENVGEGKAEFLLFDLGMNDA
ncbi:RmlC-like cupin [Periconia macrospinosa]|uniref:RmlC-like cupin n=1 Tax=Periconia macrospinosa TaxID=97972 RepID=A0A2V1DWE1_9PLEO|nr:RmlC-like cupin [Periconia macrospinosa]